MSKNITKHNFTVSREQREANAGHKGKVIWFTGLSGSGKSTLANELDAILNKRGLKTYILDGDNVRMGLNKDLGFFIVLISIQLPFGSSINIVSCSLLSPLNLT